MSNRSQGARVLLAQLSIRTSARGSPYLSGWLGASSLIAFPGEPDRWGNETWDVFLAERTAPPPPPRQMPLLPARFVDAEVD